MEALTNTIDVKEIVSRFKALNTLVPLTAIRSERGYNRSVALLNKLLDAGGANERSPLAGLVNALGALISSYEEIHYPRPAVSPSTTLKFLMEQHHLTQSDLPEIGSQGVVSEILRGKRELNVRQIQALSKRFHVPAQVFLES